jgi:hypothetical protein
VGLMLDYWGQDLPGGKEQEIKVTIINDLYENRPGTVQLRLVKGDSIMASQDKPYTIAALGREVLSFKLSVPPAPGDYTLIAELHAAGQKSVCSIRDAKVVQAE